MNPTMRECAGGSFTRLLVSTLLLAGCGSLPQGQPGRPATPGTLPAAGSEILGRDDSILVVRARAGDDAAALAQRYLGDADKGWWISEVNGEDIASGRDVLVPLHAPASAGVTHAGYRSVPVLCYHRFGTRPGKMTVTQQAFAAQMEYLAANGYRVVTLRQLAQFLEGREALPPKALAITIDDGYRSTYQSAWPVLERHGFPATVFLYTDFVGAPDAMSWDQMREMTRSGLIEIQPHSRSHPNLALRPANESAAAYRARVRTEVEASRRAIADRLGQPVHSFAYPYGVVNDEIAEQVHGAGIALGLTVTPGGNGFFADPHMLRRTMIFGDDSMASFKAKLQVFVPRSDR